MSDEPEDKYEGEDTIQGFGAKGAKALLITLAVLFCFPVAYLLYSYVGA